MHPALTESNTFESTTRLTRDLATSAKTMGLDEVKHLVWTYYAMQDQRKAASQQIQQLKKEGAPHEVLTWSLENQALMEQQVQRALDRYTDGQELGRWCKSLTGLGPVITAGLMSEIDISRCSSPSHLWSFAGLNPMQKWEKGEKRPWNASLKRLRFLLGESFVKQSGRESDYYGKLYLQRKEYEQRKNEAGEYADEAARNLAERSFDKDTQAKKFYTGKIDPRLVRLARLKDVSVLNWPTVEDMNSGKRGQLEPFADEIAEMGELVGVPMLPLAHIHMRCTRWTVKIFLDHYYFVARTIAGLPIAEAYVFAQLKHADKFSIPNWPMQK